MERINPKYRYPVTPLCNPRAVVQGKDYRFTVLTPSLIRAEYSEDGCFEDRATQVVVNRGFPVPDFLVERMGNTLQIRTAVMELCYEGGPFSANSVMIRNKTFRQDWHWGDDTPVLPGTARTLDGVNGACLLQPSILSAQSVAVLDDSNSLILDDDGWVEPRASGGADVYLFCHHHDYLAGLRDYCDLTGRIPLLPRFAFGNWWSRYHPYTQEEYEQLMARFKAEGIPFSVAVIDMDWHKVAIDRKYGTGWTGFSWNTALFPDHSALLKHLHEEGMEVTLNLHPAEGISAHEDCYPEMAKRMEIDPASGQNIPFDVTNPRLLEQYFDTLVMAVGKIVAGQVMAIAFALMINEVRNRSLKKSIQTVMYLPHFVSWVIYATILKYVIGTNGLIENMLKSGGMTVSILGTASWFQPLMIMTDTMKEYGWSAIIYLSALTAIDQGLYEAAEIDGATRWKQTLHVTIPGISHIIVLNVVLSLGGILSANFDQIFNMYNPLVMSTGDVIDTWVYRQGLISFNYGVGTAVGLFRSVIAMILTIIAYWGAYKFADYRIF